MGTINTQTSQARKLLLIPMLMGTNSTMSKEAEKKLRAERAERLQQARRRANLGGAKALADRFQWSANNYKAHESGRNGFGIADAKKYAKAFNVSVEWLYLGKGSPNDEFKDSNDLRSQAINLFDELPEPLQAAALEQIRALLKLKDIQSPQAVEDQPNSTSE